MGAGTGSRGRGLGYDYRAGRCDADRAGVFTEGKTVHPSDSALKNGRSVGFRA